MRGAHDIGHRLAVVGEVGLGEAMDDVRAAVLHHVGQVGADVAQGAAAEVGNAGLDSHTGKIASKGQWVKGSSGQGSTGSPLVWFLDPRLKAGASDSPPHARAFRLGSSANPPVTSAIAERLLYRSRQSALGGRLAPLPSALAHGAEGGCWSCSTMTHTERREASLPMTTSSEPLGRRWAGLAKGPDGPAAPAAVKEPDAALLALVPPQPRTLPDTRPVAGLPDRAGPEDDPLLRTALGQSHHGADVPAAGHRSGAPEHAGRRPPVRGGQLQQRHGGQLPLPSYQPTASTG